MSRRKVLHLFNSFEVGGVERQHMMLVRELASDHDQACWSYINGPIQDELDQLSIPHRVGRFDAAVEMIESGEFDCVVLRTIRYMREMAAYFNAHPMPRGLHPQFPALVRGQQDLFRRGTWSASATRFRPTPFSGGPSLLRAALSWTWTSPARRCCTTA